MLQQVGSLPKPKVDAAAPFARTDPKKMKFTCNPIQLRGDKCSSHRGERDDVVAMLHDLYTVYPQENHALLAQALLQARKNLVPHGGQEAVQKEVGRLLDLLATDKMKPRKRKAHPDCADGTIGLSPSFAPGRSPK